MVKIKSRGRVKTWQQLLREDCQFMRSIRIELGANVRLHRVIREIGRSPSRILNRSKRQTDTQLNRRIKHGNQK